MRASYADLVEKTAPAVVTVRSERKVAASQTQYLPFDDPMFRQFFGDRLPQMKQQHTANRTRSRFGRDRQHGRHDLDK